MSKKYRKFEEDDDYVEPDPNTAVNATNPATAEGNPFYEPIKSIAAQVRGLSWTFPYIVEILVWVVSFIVILVLCALYITIGIISQLSSTFGRLIKHTQRQLKDKSAMQKTGFIMAIGVYSVIWLPFWILQLPFYLIGLTWGFFNRPFRIVFSIILIIIGIFIFYKIFFVQ
jgi:hypothetical protein